MATELDRAYAHCQQVTRSEARNFYYAFRTLPARKRRAIYAAYAFCRLCDDIADEDLPLDEKRRRFARTRGLLRQSQNGTVAHPVYIALRDASAAFGIPATYFDEVVEGVEMDLATTRYESFDELRAYCYKVASVVGLISIEVFEYSDPAARRYAIDLGLAMQLTNIIRDVREDAQRGRVYIPLEDLRRHGYSVGELQRGVVNKAFRDVMTYQVERARRYFDTGRRLIPLLSPESRACPAVLHGIYSGILDRVEAADYDVFRERIGLGSTEKLFLMAKLWAASLIPSLLGNR